MDTTSSTGPTKPALVGTAATTPRRQSASKRSCREGNILMAYAIELGGRVPMTDTHHEELERRGLQKHRIYNAVYELKKFYGMNVTDERDGKIVLAYVIPL